jgi:hypothetical protein
MLRHRTERQCNPAAAFREARVSPYALGACPGASHNGGGAAGRGGACRPRGCEVPVKTGEKIAVGGLVVLALVATGAGILAPLAMREVRRVSAPIQRMKASEKAIERLRAETGWTRPDRDVLTAEQLDRFFTARRGIEAARIEAASTLGNLPRQQTRSLEGLKQVPGVIEGVSGVVTAEANAFVGARISPEEYRWVERVVYERWRGPLRRERTYPVAARDAAAEIHALARLEPDGPVRARLQSLADELRRRQPDPPPGIDTDTHRLLLARIDNVERWSMDDLRHAPGAR